MPAKCPIKAQAKADGKQYYYTGKPCVNGHICERRVHKSVCLLCEKERKDKFWSKFDDPSKALSDWKKEYYSKNPSKLEQLKSKNLARYHSDVEFKKRHNEINRKNWSIRRQNPDYVASENKRIAEWSKNNKPKRTAMLENRRCALLNATPTWLTAIQKAQIAEFYEIAEALNTQTGVKHHVDHIVPLKGKTVTGLHAPWNLQILTATQNISKGNRYEI